LVAVVDDGLRHNFFALRVRVRIEPTTSRRNRSGNDRQNSDDEQDRTESDAVLIVERPLLHAADSANESL